MANTKSVCHIFLYHTKQKMLYRYTVLENALKTWHCNLNIVFMKATGIVRKIDDLGLVVIPKEITRTLRIREGDLLLTNIDRFNQIHICYMEN